MPRPGGDGRRVPIAAVLLILSLAATSGAGPPEEAAGYAGLIETARARLAAGDFAGADAAFEAAHRLAVERGQPLADRIDALRGRVDALSETYAFRDLLSVSRLILDAQIAGGDEEGARHTRLDVGFLETWLGNASAALPVLREALAGAEAAGEPDVAAAARARLADACIVSGQFGLALRHALAAERHFEESGDLDSLLEVRLVLAALRDQTGDPEGARAILLALDGWLAEDAREYRADVLLCLGRLDLAAGAPEAAVARCRRAAGVLREIGDRQRLSDVLLLRGDAEVSRGRRAAAALAYLGACSTGRGSAFRETGAELRLARLLLRERRIDEAEGLLRAAVSRAEAGGEVLAASEAHAGLAEAALARGRAAEARDELLRSLDLSRVSTWDLSPTRHALTVEMRRSFTPFALAGPVARALPNAEDALVLLEQVRAEAAWQAMGEDGRYDEAALDADERARLTALRGRVAEARAECAGAEASGRIGDIRAAQAALTEAFRRLEERLSTHQRGRGDGATAAGSVRERLAPEEALVVFERCGERLLALVVTPRAARWADLGPTRATRDALAALREAVTGRDAAPDPAAAAAAIVAPLALPPEAGTILLCPEGPVGTAPWPLLLPDRTVVLLPSTDVLSRRRGGEGPPGDALLALAAPALSTNATPEMLRLFGHPRALPDLPGARREVDGVRRDGDVVFTDAAASETGLRRALSDGRRWRAIHLACHGLPNAARPAWAALALAPTAEDDGFLTVSEVCGLRVHADLVVLSACDTALGREVEGEGVLGLPAAFLHAGAARVVASLWKVEDEATRILMSEFYARFRPPQGGGLPAARALREAREALRARPGFSHPVHWAGWILWGRPD